MEKTKKNTVRENIINHRNARGWTQADLAERLGMKTTTYAVKEVKGDFKTSELLLVSEALNIDVKEFFTFNDSEINTSTVQRLNEHTGFLDSEPELLPTAKERAVIQIMRSSKQNKDVVLSVMDVLRKKNISDETVNKVLQLLNEES